MQAPKSRPNSSSRARLGWRPASGWVGLAHLEILEDVVLVLVRDPRPVPPLGDPRRLPAAGPHDALLEVVDGGLRPRQDAVAEGPPRRVRRSTPRAAAVPFALAAVPKHFCGARRGAREEKGKIYARAQASSAVNRGRQDLGKKQHSQ